MILLRNLLLISLLSFAAEARGAAFRELEPALDVARSEGKLVLVDVYAVWCAPCKVFTKATQTDDTLARRIEDFVFVKIDAEKGKGVEIARRYGAAGFPTFLLLDSEAQLVARWYGWSGVEQFLDVLDTAAAEPITLAETQRRHAESPTVRGAKLLAHDAYARREYAEAIAEFGKLAGLEPERALENRLTLVRYLISAVAAGGLGVDALDQAALPLLDDPRLGGPLAMGVARTLAQSFQGGDRERLAPYLSKALELSAGERQPGLVRQRQVLQVMHALIVEKDKDLALKYRRALLTEGWENDPAELNAFAWWCFGEKVNLEEAGQLALRAVSLETEPKSKANILDTAAEIRFALGDAESAIELIDQAIALYPSNPYLKKQRARFEEHTRGSTAGTGGN